MRHLNRFLPLLLAVAVLLAGGLSTFMAAKALDDGIHAQARLQFNKELDSVKQALQTHLQQLVTLMQGARGAFASSSDLNRDEFNMLVESMELRTRYTDVSALNYVARVPAAEVQTFVATREEELPRYQFRYASEPLSATRDFDHYIVDFAEPASARRAVGLEVSTHVGKLSAMDRAARSGTAVLTPPLILDQDASNSYGFGFFLPVYASGLVPHDLADRERLLTGFIAVGFTVKDFMANALRGVPLNIDIELADPLATSPDGQELGVLLYDRDNHLGGKLADITATRNRMLEERGQHFLGNRYFDLYASTTPEFEARFSHKVVWLTGTTGALLTMMTAGWVFVLTRNAQRQDQKMPRLGADNERLAGVVKSATNLVVITDPHGCITWVNPAFETLTGYSMADAAGFKPGALLQCDDTDPTTIAQLSQAIRARLPIQTEILNQAKDGRRYWVSLSIQPQWAANGELKGFMAIEQDVTQRREAQAQMEAAMRETAALMGTINLHAIVSQTDKRGIITLANQAFVDISGYSQEELVGRSHNIVNSGYHPPTFWQDMWASIRAGQPWHGVVCNRNKGGGLYWVDTLVAPFLDAAGHIERYVSIRTDITARMQVQRALEKAQRDLELSNWVARIGTWELDVTQDRMMWSTVTRELYQVPTDFVISRQAALRFFPEGPVRDNARAAMRQALDTGAGWDIEQQLLTFTGEPIWVRSIAVTEMEGDRCVRVYGTFQDITDRKQRELEMERARLTLQSTIDGTGAATWEWNVQTRQTVFNAVWASMLGYSLDELQPTTIATWERFCHPDDLPQAQAALQWHFSGVMDTYESVHRMRHRDGHWVWVRDTGRVVSRTAEGKPLMMYGTHIDISAFKQAQLDAETSKGRLESLIEGTRAGTVDWDLQTHEMDYNNRWSELLGYAPGELSHNAIELLKQTTHPDDYAACQAMLKRHWRGELPYHDHTFRALHKQGHVVWVQDRGRVTQRADDGRPLRMGGIRLDVTELVRAREEAAEKERTLRGAIDALGEAFVLYDADDRLVYCNERYRELYPLAAHMMQPGTRFEDIIRYGAERGEYPAAVGRVDEWVAERMAQHREARVDLVQRLTTGRVLRIVERMTPDGYRVGFRIDITELEQARASAIEKEHLLTSALESVGAALSVFDADERLVLANDRFFAIHQPLKGILKVGITFQAFIEAGLNAGAIQMDGPTRDAWLAQRLASFRTGQTDMVVPLSDGTALRVVERRTPDGLTVGLRFDVTELENARRTAQQALVRQQAIFDVLPVGITITDPAGHIIDCNPASERLLGISKAEHLARDYASKQWAIFREDGTLLPPEDYASVRALTSHQAVRDQVMRVQRGDGGEVVLSVSAVPVEDADLGVVVGYVDITDQVNARAEAEAASRSKSQFVANMSHEIRTPMNAILGMLHLLQTTPLSARQKDYAEKSESAAKSLLGILNDILDFSKVEAGKMELDPEPFSLDKFIRDLGVIYSSNAKAKQLELLFDIDHSLPKVLIGDSLRLQQVLINLGGNAIKFTAQGEVLLRVHQEARRTQDGQDVVDVLFEVHDSGIGIAPDAQAKIFSGFTQAESSTSRKYGGTGLGLAISQRLVRLMGGELQLSSAVGEGSTFFFRIPLRVPAEVPVDFAPRDFSALPNLKALVVDDNLVAQQIMTGMVQSLGWSVELAESPEAALALYAGSDAALHPRFDVVFLDWDMPGMDGLTLAVELSKRFGEGHRPIMIMVTASGREALQAAPEYQQEALDGFLVKPVTASMLYDATAEAMSVASGAAPAAVQIRAGNRSLNGMKLLVVEDNLINQQVAQELLTREGARVQLANNGQEGVDMLRTTPDAWDLVLMDMQMPVLDGLQATHAIRNRLHLLELPIVAMTANAMASDREACLAAGMNDHVGKPFELQHLIRTLLRWAGHAVKPFDPASDAAESFGGETAAQPLEVSDKSGASKSIASSDGGQKSSEFDWRHADWPDPDRVEVGTALVRLGGDPTFYHRILRQFCGDLGPQAERLRNAMQVMSAQELAVMLHTLKGTSSTVGASKLAGLVAAAERSVKHQVAEGVAVTTDWLAGLREEMAATEVAVSRVLQAFQQQLHGTAPASATGAAQSNATTDWRERWATPLSQLADLLEASDMDALGIHDDMLQDPSLASHPDADWQALHAAMEQMDFEQALVAARALLAQV